jgi:hypothetical protein
MKKAFIDRLLITFVILFPITGNAQLTRKEFVIGAFVPPYLVTESATPAPADYNGDRKADLASRINSGFQKGKFQIDFFINQKEYFKNNGWTFVTATAIYGDVDDKILNADYDNDKKADICIYFPKSKILKIDFTKNGFDKWDTSYSYHLNKDIDETTTVIAGDFDADNKKDICFTTSSGKWLIDCASNGLGTVDLVVNNYGEKTDKIVPEDYDGDGVFDLSVKTNEGVWKIDFYKNEYKGWDVKVKGCGDSSSFPVPGDYNGDGRADISVKTNNGEWKVASSLSNNKSIEWIPNSTGAYYGGVEAIPYPADFNGDGKTDFSFVFPYDGRWLIDNFSASTNGYDWISDQGKLANDYNVNNLNPADIASYIKLRECNFNLVIDGMASLKNNFQKDYFLLLMDRVNLLTMLSDPHIYSYGDVNDDAAFNKREFVERYNTKLSQRLKNRIYAINLGDEPVNQKFMPDNAPGTMEKAQAWATFFKKEYPQKPVFNNLLPRIYQRFHSDTDYLEYLDLYKAYSKSQIVGFDHYPFGAKSFDRVYFNNLALIKSRFGNEGFWATVWSTVSKINSYLDPDEKQFRFMAFCPIAYGATGITYFPYDKYLNPNFSKAINDDSSKYKSARNINLFLKNIVGPVVMSSDNIATLHSSNTLLNEGYPFKQSELIAYSKTILKQTNNDNLLFGILKAKDQAKPDGKYFIWMVNKDLNKISDVIIKLDGNYLNKILLSPSCVNYIKNPVKIYKKPVTVSYNTKSNVTSFTIPVVEGGEGRMIKLMN